MLFVPLFALCLLPGCLVPLPAPEPVLVLLVHLPGPLLELGLLALLFVHLLCTWAASTPTCACARICAECPLACGCACALLLLLHFLLVSTYLYRPCRPNLPPLRWPQQPLLPHLPPFNPSHYHQGRGQRRTRRSMPCSPSSATSLAMRHLLHCASWPPPGPRPAILGLPPALPAP